MKNIFTFVGIAILTLVVADLLELVPYVNAIRWDFVAGALTMTIMYRLIN